jgi:hypothetical protein
MPSKILPFVLTRGDFDFYLDPQDTEHEICDGNLIVVPYSYDPSQLKLCVVPIPHEVDDQAWSSAFHRDLLIGPKGGELKSVKISPATGRFCILTADGEIRIIDCLPHCS